MKIMFQLNALFKNGDLKMKPPFVILVMIAYAVYLLVKQFLHKLNDARKLLNALRNVFLKEYQQQKNYQIALKTEKMEKL